MKIAIWKWDKWSLISITACWRGSASALKLVEYFLVARVMCATPIIVSDLTHLLPSCVASNSDNQ